jgi:hypothetical protein
LRISVDSYTKSETVEFRVSGFFKKRTGDVESKIGPSGDVLAQQAVRILEILKEVAADTEIFALLGGAVFALQQDTIRAMACDMRQLPDPITQAALDKLQPHPAGVYHERFSIVFGQLEGINNAFLDALDRTDALDEVDRLFFNMGATAARIWLVTLASHASKDIVQKTRILAIWKFLDLLELDDILVYAQSYTGRFYNGVKCETFQIGHWGLLPDMR